MGSNAMLIQLVARSAVVFLLVVLAAGKASAQFDFVGSWAPLGTEDVQNDSLPADYLGLALTDEGRTRALSYDEAQSSMLERQCRARLDTKRGHLPGAVGGKERRGGSLC